MKISRFKKSQRILNFYANNFNYREPYQVLIDATFCQAALKNKVLVEEQLQKYFQSQIKLITTQCIILEAESIGGELTGATMIVKKFHVHKCGHEKKAVTGVECIKSMTDSRYIIASQDRNLQACLRKIPGRAILYLHKAAPVLEAPSEAWKKYVAKKLKQFLPKTTEKQIEAMKQSHGIPITKDEPLRKSKKPKNPNPLSCKKKKNKQQTCSEKKPCETTNATSMKPKRRRMKIAPHLKEFLKNSQL